MAEFKQKDHYTYEDLLALTAFLRAPGGCPWDGAQDHHSIRRNFIEEAYEACEAIDQEDSVHLCEELGDVMYQVLFHADLEREAGRFSMDEVCDGICKKLVSRHPNLFANDESWQNAEVAVDRWDEVKRKLNGQKTVTETLDSVSRTLPSLWRAEKLQRKAAKAGFVWADASEALQKLEEEVAELRRAIEAGEGQREEMGDVLFAAVSVASQLQVDPEDALNETSEKFIRRFGCMEQQAAASQCALESLERDDLLRLWEQAKGH